MIDETKKEMNNMQEKKDVIDVFSKNKHAYVTSETHAKGSDLSLVEEWVMSRTYPTALDIATGGGHVARVLSQHCTEVFVTDITKDMLEHTATYFSNHEHVHFIIADAEKLPFLDQSFDLVTCRIAAHHFPQPEKFIREVYRVLKPNGTFIFIDNVASEQPFYDLFINTVEKLRDYSHLRALKVSEWKQLFQSNKLVIKEEIVRKKTLNFKDWVHRTLDNEEKIEFVRHMLQHAPHDIQTHYELQKDNDQLLSFAIDEWIVFSQRSE